MKKKEKSPAFSWYPRHILGSARVAMMTVDEELAYRRALDFCWINNGIPADPALLARMVGKGCTAEIAAGIVHMFIPKKNDPSQLTHERLEIERKKQKEHAKKSKKGGIKSGETRRKQQLIKKNEETKGGSVLVPTKDEPNSKLPSPFPLSQQTRKKGVSSDVQDESDEAYFERKQKEFVWLNVREVYQNFLRNVGSEKYRYLKNTRAHFDKWLENEDIPLTAPTNETGTVEYIVESTGKPLR